MTDGRHSDSGTRTRSVLLPARMIVAWVAALLAGTLAEAHPASMTAAVASVSRDGHVGITLTFDVLACALNDRPERVPDDAMLKLLDGPDAELDRRLAAASARFQRQFRIVARTGAATALVSARMRFPDAVAVRAAAARSGPRLPVQLPVQIDATLSAGTTAAGFRFPDVIGAVVLTVERPALEPTTEVVSAGDTSALLAFAPTAGIQETTSLGRVAAVVGEFVRLGFVHVFPRGLDHVLFVLGLFLMGGTLSRLLWQVTAFTVAHSLTLGLALYGIIRAPSGLVEPLIAFSIVLVAADNLRTSNVGWWRVVVVFGFGLVHGLGFAAALRELGLQPANYAWALLGFNAGVELGQLTVIALAFVAVGWWRDHRVYRPWIVIPASVCIGCVAVVWTVTRLSAT